MAKKKKDQEEDMPVSKFSGAEVAEIYYMDGTTRYGTKKYQVHTMGKGNTGFLRNGVKVLKKAGKWHITNI